MPGFPIPLMHFPVEGGYPSVIMYDETTVTLRALQYDGEDWLQVGTPLVVTGAGRSALCWLTGDRFVLASNGLDALRCYSFNGTTFAQVGVSFALAMGDPALARMDDTNIAFYDNTNDSLRCYAFSGTNFSLVGSGLPITTADNPSMASQSSTQICLTLDGGPRIYTFNGSTWTLTGPISSFLWTPAVNSRVASMPNGVLAGIDSNSGSIRALRNIGLVYQTGNTLPITGFTQAGAIAAISSSEVAVIDGNGELMRTYTLDLSTGVGVWTQTGNTLSIPGIANPALCSFGNFGGIATLGTGNQWNPAQTSINITLSQSNTIANKTATGTGNMTKCLEPCAIGHYYEITSGNLGSPLAGIAGAASTTATYPGDNGNAAVRPSAGWFFSGTVYANFTAGTATGGAGNWLPTVGVLVEASNIKFYNTATGTLINTTPRNGVTADMYPAMSVSDGAYAVINPSFPFRYLPPGALPMQ